MIVNDLEGHFTLKSCLGDRHIIGLHVLAFGQNCLEIYRAMHILSVTKNVAQRLVSGNIS